MQFNEVEDKTMQDLTALFTNMQILTIAFFSAVNHLNGPIRKTLL